MKTKDTESEILKAAEQEFMLKGFDGAKTTSIAHAAGVTHAMLHYYFRTKEQLFERILTEKVQLMSESVLAAFGQPGLPLLERLKDGVTCHFDFIAANPQLPRFIVNEVFSRPERYKLMSDKIVKVADCLRKVVLNWMSLQERKPMQNCRQLSRIQVLSIRSFPTTRSWL